MIWTELPSWLVAFLGYFAAIYGAGFACGYLPGVWRRLMEPDERD